LLALALVACDARKRADGSQPPSDAGVDTLDAGSSETGSSTPTSPRTDASPDTADTGPPEAEAPERSDAPIDVAIDGVASASDGSTAHDVVDSGAPCLDTIGLACGCGGTVLCNGSCSERDDTCIPVGEWFFLTNMFLGNNRRLDTYAGPPDDAFMSTSDVPTSGQHWKITALGGGYYRLTNMFAGDGLSLRASADGTKVSLGPSDSNTANYWRITAAFGDYFFLSSMLLGTTKRLDVMNTTANEPWLAPTTDSSGQYWKLTKAPQR
jgi:hypothetical protein